MQDRFSTHLQKIVRAVRPLIIVGMVSIALYASESNSQPPGEILEVTSNEFRFIDISAAKITYDISSISSELQFLGGIFSLELVPSPTGILSNSTPGLHSYELCTAHTCPFYSKTEPVVSFTPQSHVDGKTVYRIRARAQITNSEGAPIYVDARYPSIKITNAVLYLRGDYNYDGVVNAADYTVWRDTRGTSRILADGADGSGNGTIDIADFTMWRSRFGQFVASSSSSSAAVPEHSTLTSLAVIGVLCVASMSRGRASSRRLQS